MSDSELEHDDLRGQDLVETSAAAPHEPDSATLLDSESVLGTSRPASNDIPSSLLVHLWLTCFIFAHPAPAYGLPTVATALSSLDHVWVRLSRYRQQSTVGGLLRCFLPHAQSRMLRLLLLNGSPVGLADTLPQRPAFVLQLGLVKMPCLLVFRLEQDYVLVDITTTVQDLLVHAASHWNIQLEGLSLLWKSTSLSPHDFALGRDSLRFQVCWQPTIVHNFSS